VQSRVDPRGRKRWIKVSPTKMNLSGKLRWHYSPVDGEKSKFGEPMGPLGRGATGEGHGNSVLSPDSLAGMEARWGRAATVGRSRAALSA
jgi:hypothetical protein